MAKAFVLINAEPASEKEILERLREVPEVKEAHFMYGVYDFIAEVETDSMNRLKEVVYQKVRKLDKVRATITIIVVEEE
jgi:DNA-binding Lrp family transcriptional regulator